MPIGRDPLPLLKFESRFIENWDLEIQLRERDLQIVCEDEDQAKSGDC
ncbi:unnamed protein product [Arabidopsis halleri]